MASRAYFRCRACGEPVMAGAYRCPVCGVDFPSGTPGAPDRTDGGGATAEPRARPAPPPPPRPTPDDADPAPTEVGDDNDDSLDFSPRPSHRESQGTADLNVRPREAPSARGPSDEGAASLSVRPARESVAVAVTPREAPSTALVPRRRSWSRSLAGTLFSAILLLTVVAAGAFFVQQRGLLPTIGSTPTMSVTFEDGWVDLPTEEHPLVVSADGPYRLRISGKVYSLRGDQTIKVPAATEASVRVVRAPATATVAPQ